MPIKITGLKWKRGLSDNLVSRIEGIKPREVRFEYKHGCWVECIIQLGHGRAVGLAICSTLDDFNLNRGKEIAAGRAFKVINKLITPEGNSAAAQPIRKNIDDFPKGWKNSQAKQVMEVAKKFNFKMLYISAGWSWLGCQHEDTKDWDIFGDQTSYKTVSCWRLHRDAKSRLQITEGD